MCIAHGIHITREPVTMSTPSDNRPDTRDFVPISQAERDAFALAVKDARKEAQLGQEPLGAAVGVDRKTIGRWENEGDLQPQTRYLAILMRTSPEARDAILRALDVQVPATGPEEIPQIRRFVERMIAGVEHGQWDLAANIIDDALRIVERSPPGARDAIPA